MNKNGINVLSLFDGMSGGQIALERAGIKVNKYYASEIDKYAIEITQHNYPNTIHLGNIKNIRLYSLPKIDLIIGGSPCQSFSFAGKMNGMSTKDKIEVLSLEQYIHLKKDGFEFEGQSYLFWEYVRILELLKSKNPEIKFLLENVRMAKKWKDIISEALGVDEVEINSALVSAQNRRRLYWTNISNGIIPPLDKKIFLSDIIEEKVDEKYYLSEKQLKYVVNNDRLKKKFTAINGEKAITLMAGYERLQGTHIYEATAGIKNSSENKLGTLGARYYKGVENFGSNPFIAEIDKKTRVRKLTPIECERLQTVPDNYTSRASDTQRYKMLGNGWTVDVISHIFGYI